MENVKVEEIAKIVWSQTSTTKVGKITEEITQNGSMYKTVILVNDKTITYANHVTEQNAFFWLYGVKQWLNDKVAGYKAQGDGMFVKEIKGKGQYFTQQAVTDTAVTAYNDWKLPSTSESKGEKKVKASDAENVLASLGLSPDVLARARQAMGLPPIATDNQAQAQAQDMPKTA